jgi:Mg2+ and Co2+ transporter CorA
MMTRAKVRKTTKQATGGRRKKATPAKPPVGVASPRAAPTGKVDGPAGRGSNAVARSRSLPTADAAVAVDVEQILQSVATARAALVEIQDKLNSISEAALDKLSKDDQEAWADELAETNNAIVKLDTVALKAINDDFAGRVAELEQKTKALAASLQKMNDVADIIASIGKVIQIVTDIASLIK